MLHLKSLKLDGFLSYRDPIVIALDNPGITVIQGPTGSGKSVIFEAVHYLMFGTIIRDKSSINDLVYKSFTEESAGYDIQLELDIDGVLYTIQEVRGRKLNGLFFCKAGVDIRESDTLSTRKKIKSVLGVSEEEFSSMCFIGQDKSQTMVSGTSADRANAIVSMFGLSSYDDAINKCGLDLKRVKGEIETLTSTAESLDDDILKTKEMLSEDPTSEEKDASSLCAELDKVRKKVLVLQGRERVASQKIRDFEQYQKSERTRKELEEELRILSSVPEPPEGGEAALSLHEEKNKKVKEYTGVAAVARNKLKEVHTGNTCPVSGSMCPVGVPSAEKDRVVAEANTTITRANTEISVLQEGMKKDYANWKVYTECNEALIRKLRVESTLAGLRDTSVVVAVDSCTAEREKCVDALGVGNSKISDLTAKILEVELNNERVKERRKANERVLVRVGELESKKSGVLEQISEKTATEIILKDSFDALKQAKTYKMESVFELLNANLRKNIFIISSGEYAAEFVTQKASASGKKTLEHIDILVRDGTKELPIGMVSGGQRAQVGAAVLLSVFEAVRSTTDKGCSSIWLDEIFGPISSDVVGRVFDAITAVANRLGVASVKIITHKDIDTRAVDCIWKTELVNGATELTTT